MMNEATAACKECGGTGTVGVRTCHHSGNCPCAFDEQECICILRGWAMAAVMQEAVATDDEVLRQDALEEYERIKNGEEDDWLVSVVDQYREWRRQMDRRNHAHAKGGAA